MDSKNQNLLTQLPVLAIIAMAFLVGYLFSEVKSLKKGYVAPSANKEVGVGGGGDEAKADNQAAPEKATDSPISVMNLKKYAKELGMDSGKFDKCLDGGEKAALVKSDTAQGSTLGVRGTPGFFINGRFLGGAFPFESFKEIIDMELAGKGSSDITAYSKDLQDAAKSEAFDPKPKAVDIASAPARGEGSAKVTIVEYSDFECPYCVRAYDTIKQVESTYAGKVKLVYKHYPLDFHPNAQKAAEAGACASDQGKFWELHDKMFSVQKQG